MKEKIRQLLSESGWYKGRNRSIDLEDDFLSLKREGYFMPDDNIKKLICEFWNIDIQFQYDDGFYNNIDLNIERALDSTDYFIIHRIELLINKLLLPVGTIQFGSGLVLIANDFSFYLINEENLYLVGNNFIDFLETVIEKKEITLLSFN